MTKEGVKKKNLQLEFRRKVNLKRRSSQFENVQLVLVKIFSSSSWIRILILHQQIDQLYARERHQGILVVYRGQGMIKEHMCDETSGSTGWHRLGALMIAMGQFDKAAYVTTSADD